MAVALAKVLWWTSSHFRVMVPQKEYGCGATTSYSSYPILKKPSENPKISSTY